MVLSVLQTVVCLPFVSAFYLPGLHPTAYQTEESIPIQVGRVGSANADATYGEHTGLLYFILKAQICVD